LKVGLGVAVDYALGVGLEAIEARVRALAAALRERLEAIPGVGLHDTGRERCAIVTFSVAGRGPDEVAAAAAAAGINVSVSPRSSALFDFARRGLGDIVRASVHYYNTEAELDRLARVVAEAARAS
jgi:cysteine desulfurase / selenocysteine lyase